MNTFDSKYMLFASVAPRPEAEGGGAGAQGGDPPTTNAGEGAAASPAPDTGGAPAAQPVAQPWERDRIRTLTARLHEARAQLAAVAKPQAVEGTQPQLTQADVEARAAQIAAGQAFNDACNVVANRGRQDFGEAQFNARIRDLASLQDPGNPQQYNTFLEAAIATDEGAKVLHALGGDMNEAARIMALSPMKMAAELTKIALREVKPISQAPKPIQPLASKNASATVIEPDDPQRGATLDTASWMKQREAQVKAQREVRGMRR